MNKIAVYTPVNGFITHQTHHMSQR